MVEVQLISCNVLNTIPARTVAAMKAGVQLKAIFTRPPQMAAAQRSCRMACNPNHNHVITLLKPGVNDRDETEFFPLHMRWWWWDEVLITTK